jgi:putative membrane protein
MRTESYFILHWLVSGIAVLVTSKLVPGFDIDGYFAALIAAVFIGLANAIVYPVLFWLTFPITFLTLGLFIFVLNGAILKLCAVFLPGFHIESWGAAIFGSIVLSLVAMALHFILV